MSHKYRELASFLEKNNDTEYIKNILDSTEYYNIFSVAVHTDLLWNIYNNMNYDCFEHVILSRKIAWQDGAMLDKIARTLLNDHEIEHFFSLYDHQEIINMINFDMRNNKYSYYDIHIYYTFGVHCMKWHHRVRFGKYITNYLQYYMFRR